MMSIEPRNTRVTTQEHTGMLTLAAVTALLNLAEHTLAGGVAGLAQRHPFVQSYARTLAEWLPAGISWEASVAWWADHLACVEADEPNLPLPRVSAPAGVRERMALALVALPEEDARFLAVLRELGGADLDAVPVAIVVAALERPGERTVARSLARLTQQHLIETLPGRPSLCRSGSGFWSVLRDDMTWSATEVAAQPASARTIAHWGSARQARLRRPLDLLREGRIDTVLVRHVPGAEAQNAVSAAWGGPIVWLAPDQVMAGTGLALAEALNAVPGVRLVAAPGEHLEIPRPEWYRGPLLVVAGISGGFRDSAAGDRRASVLLDRCDAAERRALWATLLPDADDAKVTVLGSSFVLPDGHVRRLAADAQVIAEVAGRTTPEVADVRRAARALGDTVLETTATRLDNDGLAWDDVVTAPVVRQDLRLLEHRCRLREDLAVGDRGVGGPGIRALLSGPSGCGKTLAARTLGAVLDRSVYRVDLASVFDKYVGVTEKILDSLLTEAEQLDTVLLLDEGDTLLGSRTDVRSANDRYANLETNFLLQRLETYAGIVVVTTNAPDRIDPAFARRMDMTIAFGKPRAAARRKIWALHLPAEHAVAEEELTALADHHRFTGGQIRNAVQHARLLSAKDDVPVDLGVVSAAVAAEYRKAGALVVGAGPTASPHAAALHDYVLGMAQAARDRRGGGRP